MRRAGPPLGELHVFLPKFIPLSAASVRQIVESVEPFAFERIYSAFWSKVVLSDAKEAVRRSAERYIKAINEH